MFAKEIYIQRRAQLMKIVGNGLILIPGNNELPYNYPSNTMPFRQDSTFLYYIGIDKPGLVAVLDCESGETVLFGNAPTIDDIIWNGTMSTIPELASLSGIEKNMTIAKLSDYCSNNTKLHYIYPYHADLQILISNITDTPIHQLKVGQSHELINAIVSMRRIKSYMELEEMEKSTNITAEMHCSTMRMIGEAIAKESVITERHIYGQISKVAMTRGYYHSFPPIVTVHGEIFHSHTYRETLRKGSMLLLDAGAESIEHYAGDMTRTIPVSGKFSKRQKDIYDLVVKANMGVIQSAKPGILWRDMHSRAARIITSGLKDLGLMKGDTDDIVAQCAYALFFPHGLGHLVGLDVHDMEPLGEDFVGYNDEIHRSKLFGPNNLRFGLELEKNMVITDEPGIYFIPQLIDQWKNEGKFKDYINYDRVEKYKGFGGVRIEDELQITENGCRVMGSPVPKDSSSVEDYIERWSAK